MAVCAAVIEVLRPVIRSAQVDVITDFPEQMPEDVRRAEAELAAVAEDRERRGRGGRMGLVVNTGDPEWSAVASYAGWSIDANLTGADGEDLATFHDCGHSVVAALTEDEVVELRTSLAPIAPVNCSVTFTVVGVRRSGQHGNPVCAPGSSAERADSVGERQVRCAIMPLSRCAGLTPGGGQTVPPRAGLGGESERTELGCSSEPDQLGEEPANASGPPRLWMPGDHRRGVCRGPGVRVGAHRLPSRGPLVDPQHRPYRVPGLATGRSHAGPATDPSTPRIPGAAARRA